MRDLLILSTYATVLVACTSTSPRGESLGPRPQPAGSKAWEDTVRGRLLARWDDGANALSPTEVVAVPCAIWRELEADLVRDTTAGLVVTYGLEPQLLWRGDRLGLAADARAAALVHINGCVGARSELMLDATLQALADIVEAPTSDPWDNAVSAVLVRAFDQDRTGSIDVDSEVTAIPCSVWTWLDGAVASVSRYPLVALYGFADGYAWAAGALGFEHRIRDDAEAALVRCGIHTDL